MLGTAFSGIILYVICTYMFTFTSLGAQDHVGHTIMGINAINAWTQAGDV